MNHLNYTRNKLCDIEHGQQKLRLIDALHHYKHLTQILITREAYSS